MGLKERLIALAAGDGNLEKGECAHETAEMGAAEGENRLTRRLLSEVTEVTEVTSLKPKAESGNLASERKVTEVTRRLVPAGDVALGPDDPGDEGLEWCGEVEDVPPPKSDPEPHRPSLAPPVGSLQARLVAVGATVNAYGKCASVRAPAGIPLELVKDVEARGWRIIPGGKANPEAEHDSWLADVPIAELES